MKIDNKKLKQILADGQYVAVEDLKKAEDYAKTNKVSLTKYLFLEELITADLLGQAIAEDFKVPYADLNSAILTKKQVIKIPEKVAKRLRVVLFKDEEETIAITTDDPKQAGLKEELTKIFPDKKLVINYSLPDDIDDVFMHYRQALEARFVKIIKEEQKIAPELVDEILDDAFTYRASDIHFEPREKEVVVRFRIDGVLSEVGRLPIEQYESIVNRIKIQSQLRIDEHLAAQDGAIRHKKDGKDLDLRVSIAPTINGEKIVMRILSEYVRDFTLGDLGLAPADQERTEKASKKPFGMILVTGPTGSGKTTTLYAILKLLNNPGVNITTIEDPVEYKLEGVNQIQVNNRTDLTFVNGLRSIVRQDPDIVLVGEIRDEETAEIAVNAALTGHLLFSTFHSNDAATTIPRLLDMGVEPFLLASTLEVIVAQRLARQICDQCRHSVSVKRSEIAKQVPHAERYFPQETMNLYEGKGCKVCGDTGYKGRTAIFEIIEITLDMQELILQGPSTQQIRELAQKEGAKSLFEDGVEKVKQGITTLEELLRVASPPAE